MKYQHLKESFLKKKQLKGKPNSFLIVEDFISLKILQNILVFVQ